MKLKINDLPKQGTPDYSHLIPIVDYLFSTGNASVNDYDWGNNRTGYFCHLKNKIDFHDLLEHFELPPSIKLNQESQTIDCMNTYSIIRGGKSENC
ncbi:hypothetical protein [Thalassomonas haliotis]|uniref:Uncharacterized protein n=1 Tax=Thalassomonas haliotis TaxID=485448 RepID=A0ABY7VLF1_9GAMM|nr:hypothetical protein [Thalassomonas haliotis]WDE13512.1 hypothetical protein H3N35_08780 [Thalassomonas haliotis]